MVDDTIGPLLDDAGLDVSGVGASITNCLVGDCVGLSFDNVGSDVAVDDDCGLLADDDWVGLSLRIPSKVGALVTNLPVGDDCAGLPLDNVGLDTPVGEEFGLFVDAVGVALLLLGVLKDGAPNISLAVGDCVGLTMDCVGLDTTVGDEFGL